MYPCFSSLLQLTLTLSAHIPLSLSWPVGTLPHVEPAGRMGEANMSPQVANLKANESLFTRGTTLAWRIHTTTTPIALSSSCNVASMSVRSSVRQASAHSETKPWRLTGELWNLKGGGGGKGEERGKKERKKGGGGE